MGVYPTLSPSPPPPPCGWTYPKHFGLALQTFLPVVLAGGPRFLCLGHQEASRWEDHEVPTEHVMGQHAAERHEDPSLTPLGLKTADTLQLRSPWGVTRTLRVISWGTWDREHLKSQSGNCHSVISTSW